ncbi:MAG: HIT family protein [Actinomycetota bacterium]
MASVFTLIINGDLPGHFVWKDEHCVSFLSINPITDGHALIVPREEVDHWIDLDVEMAGHLMAVSHHVGHALQTVFQPQRIGQMIAGFEVPHTHVHVLGLNREADLSFANAATTVDHAELADFASRLRGALRDAGHRDQAAEPG